MTPRTRAWLEYAALCAYAAAIIAFGVYALLTTAGCTTVYVVSGRDNSLDSDQRIGRRLGPLVGDSDNSNSPKITQPRKDATP